MYSLSVSRSLFSSQSIAALLADVYGIEHCSVRLISPGMNDTYLVIQDNRKWIVRIYRSGWRSLPDVMYEVELLLHLTKRNIHLASPLPDPKQSHIQTINAPEGERYLVLFEYVEGTSPPLDSTTCHEIGEALGAFHWAARSFDYPEMRVTFGIEQLVYTPLAALEPLMSECDDHWTYVKHLATTLEQAVNDLKEGLTWGVCHGDFHAENIKRHHGKVYFFDFDLAGEGWQIYDLATMWWCLHDYGRRLRDDVHTQWHTILDAYHLLNDADGEALPYFVALRHLWMMGLHASSAPVFGYERFTQQYFDGVVGFLRAWEAAKLTDIVS